MCGYKARMCSYSNRMSAAPLREPFFVFLLGFEYESVRCLQETRAKPSVTAFVELTNGALYWTVVGCVPSKKFVLFLPKRSCVLIILTNLRSPSSPQ